MCGVCSEELECMQKYITCYTKQKELLDPHYKKKPAQVSIS